MVRRVGGVLLLVAFGLVLALLVVEVGLLATGVAPVEQLRRRPPYMKVPDRITGWSLLPGAEFAHRTAFVNFGTRVQINAVGFRERDYALERTPGVARVLILGDSVTAGFEVPLSDVWHERLEAALSDANGTGRTEIIAAGVPGWSTDQQLLYYAHEGYKYRPDLVLLQFYLNDIDDNGTDFDGLLKLEKPYFRLDGDQLVLHNFPYEGEGVWADSRTQSPVKKFLRRASRTYRLVRAVRLRQRRQDPFCYPAKGVPVDLFVFASEPTPEYVEAWKVTSAIIGRLQAEVARRGAAFAVVYFPSRRQVLPEAWRETLACWPEAETVAWDLNKPNRVLEALLRRRGISYLDLTHMFREHVRRTGEQVYLDKDEHLTARGHELAAARIVQWFQQERFLRP
ncbi:MAG: SGNH/GDSL hydrolase family protein [Armatimonadota bacterium]|nr:SGNH/GDSL hydrolase family protein [Armatimonadota bacterium]